MNANELADELISGYAGQLIMKQAATMLRQQQVEIESLRLQLSTVLANRNLRTYDGRLE